MSLFFIIYSFHRYMLTGWLGNPLTRWPVNPLARWPVDKNKFSTDPRANRLTG